jgi:hypothetical protein
MMSKTLPPEMLPVASGDDVEVVVCRGAPACTDTSSGPCIACVRIDEREAGAVSKAMQSISLRH